MVFVVEDGTQHVRTTSTRTARHCSSRPPKHGPVYHRLANARDVIATIAKILGLGSLSQVDYSI